jgi:hypothetical protein
MKTIIAGGRTFNNYNLLKESVDALNLNISEKVSGGAKGVDALGEQYANENNIHIKVFKPNWTVYGRAIGPVRNKEMAIYADVLVAFWDGKSIGIKSMINLAKENGLKVFVVSI